MRKLAFICLFTIISLSASQYLRFQSRLGEMPNYSDNLNKILDYFHKKEQDHQSQIPASQTQKPKDTSPSPQCLSQTYQALSLLYSFSADSMSQDIHQLEADFKALIPVVKNINEFCIPKVDVDKTIPVPIARECDENLDKIEDIMVKFKNGDPTHFVNVIKTIENLGAIQANFTRDCLAFPSQKTAEAQKPRIEQKSCNSLFLTADQHISRISDSAVNHDLGSVLKGFESLKETIFEINRFCEEGLRINMFPENRIVTGTCSDHFEEMRKLSLENKQDKTVHVQKIWSMVHKFLQSCH